MLVILSPAKTMDMSVVEQEFPGTTPGVHGRGGISGGANAPLFRIPVRKDVKDQS